VRTGVILAVATCALGVACNDGRGGWETPPEAVRLHAVGATVPKALLAKWIEQYALVEPSTKLVYDAEGSGAGIRVAKDGSADFGVSDFPLSDSEVTSTSGSVSHLPVAVEAIAIVYALQGAPSGRLQVTEDLLSDLLTGSILWWDDPAVGAVNPGVKLPHTAVHVVYRGDESGSSYVLSEWLSKTSKRWTRPVTRSLTLPVGVSAQRDDGMVARLRANDGTIGYVSAVTALEQHLPSLAVRNGAGRFVSPTLEAMRAAAATAQLGSDLRAHATAAPGELAYPLCSFAFVLVQHDGSDPARRHAVAHFLWWAIHDGQKFAPALGFGALPGELMVRDEDVLRSLRAGAEAAL
jgi:phosphate transport system substrate-binding protein